VHRLPIAPQVPRGLLSCQHEPSITELIRVRRERRGAP
jgi:hypothetical protein